MIERTFGQYARVLVDLDISQPLRYQVLVERKGFAFFVNLDYENVPDFCTHCKKIGHYFEICKNRSFDRVQEDVIPNKDGNKNLMKGKVTKTYVVKEQGKTVEDPIVVEGTSRVHKTTLNKEVPVLGEVSGEKAPALEIHNNKFAALGETDVDQTEATKDAMRAEDARLEAEINEEILVR